MTGVRPRKVVTRAGKLYIVGMPMRSRFRSLPLVLGSLLMLILAFGFVLGATAGKESIYRYLNVFAEVYTLVRGNYVDPVDEGTLLDGAYKGMVSGLDPFSGYLTKEEFQAFQKDPDGGPADTGLELVRRAGGAEVIAVRPGSHAEQAALRPGDQIWSIDGTPARQLSLVQIRRAQRGAPDTLVKLLVFHPKTQKREEVRLQRTHASGAALQSRLLDGRIGYLRILDLERSEKDALKSTLNALRQKGATRLLLDVRDCASGSLDDAVRIAGLFVPPGPVVQVLGRGGERTTRSSTGSALWTLPIYVLGNGGSAGGAEIIAAALRARIKAPLLGEPTYGLGSRQQLVPLGSGDGLILSTEKFLSPSGEGWNRTASREGGLKPDKEIPSTLEERSGREPDSQLQKAIDFLKPPVAKAA